MLPTVDIFTFTPAMWGQLAAAIVVVGALLWAFGERVLPFVVGVLLFSGGVNNARDGFPIAGVSCGLLASVALCHGLRQWSRHEVQRSLG